MNRGFSGAVIWCCLGPSLVSIASLINTLIWSIKTLFDAVTNACKEAACSAVKLGIRLGFGGCVVLVAGMDLLPVWCLGLGVIPVLLCRPG